jgi:hypothetical protein
MEPRRLLERFECPGPKDPEVSSPVRQGGVDVAP